MSLLTPREASQLYGVSTETLRNWCEEGKLEVVKTSGGHRRYKKVEEKNRGDMLIAYARTTNRRSGDIEKQTETFRKTYPNHKIITDIGCGIDIKRNGFQWILEQLFCGNIKEVVVADRIKFAGINTEMFEWIFNKFNAKLTVIQTEETSNDDLTDELLGTISIFTTRMRANTKQGFTEKNQDEKNEILSNKKSEDIAK